MRYFTPAIAHGERNTINKTIAILMGLYSPVWLVHSKSADNAVMNGSTRKSTTEIKFAKSYIANYYCPLNHKIVSPTS